MNISALLDIDDKLQPLRLIRLDKLMPFIHSFHPRGVMVKAMDYGIVVCEFEFQFRVNTLMNPLILPAMG